MKEEKTSRKEKILHRVVTFLNRQELDFLDSLIKDILFSTGIKIPRSRLLKTIVDSFLKGGLKDREERKSLVHTAVQEAKGGK